MNLAARSSVINVQPVEVQPGWPPEKYIITYRCRGIASVDKNSQPKVSDFHQVSMYLGSDYPLKEPYLKWLTPIWHPNIDHQEPHHVCTNNVQNWFAAKPLAELVLAMGEMVQYKHYHAKWVSPFPLDKAAADWVLEVAEPLGILGPKKPFDDRPLLQTQRMRNKARDLVNPKVHEISKRIKLGRAAAQPDATDSNGKSGAKKEGVETAPLHEPAQVASRAIRFGRRTNPAGDDTPRGVGSTAEVQDESKPPLPDHFLEISKEGQVQRIEKVDKSLVSIGRGALGRPVDLALEGDLTMSRLHAILERDENGAFWLTAKGQNPVVVAGRVIPRERSIGVDVGQLIKICSYSLKLV
jgi:hypothetical protein